VAASYGAYSPTPPFEFRFSRLGANWLCLWHWRQSWLIFFRTLIGLFFRIVVVDTEQIAVFLIERFWIRHMDTAGLLG
jgi:hypothetical protein